MKQIINIKNDIELSSFYIVFDGSSMNEKPGWYGLSHLMEHLVCKSFKHLWEDFQRYGISWNAYTSSTEIVFYMIGLKEHIEKYRYEFLDSIIKYEPTEEELLNEKKIVLEEYKDAFNQQSYSHYLNLHRKLFDFYHAIGLRNDIENFTIDDCKEYSKLYLKKPTKIVNVGCGDSEFDCNFEFKQESYYEPLSYKNFDNSLFHKILSEDNTHVPEGKIAIEHSTDFNTKSSIYNISPIITENFTKINFVCNMLGSGLNSPLYQEVREKLGLVYYISIDNDKLNDNSSVITITTETSNENVKIVQDTIKKVLENKEEFLTQERFDVIKDNILVKLKKNDIMRHENVSKYISPENWNIENIIHTITLNEVYQIMDKYFNWENFYKSVWCEEFEN